MRARSHHTVNQAQSQPPVVTTPALRLHSEDREGANTKTSRHQDTKLTIENTPASEVRVRAVSLIITEVTKTRKTGWTYCCQPALHSAPILYPRPKVK